jgi:ceramide glucosyltransferase
MMLSQTFAKPCVVGKSMLFRKSELQRFGGLKLLSEFLAEDFMAGEAMRKLGLCVGISKVPVLQVLGHYSLKSFWKRHLRWGRIRKAHAPLAFLLEPFFSPILMSSLGSIGLHQCSSLNLIQSFGLYLGMFCTLDFITYYRVTPERGGNPILFPTLWLFREILGIPLWLQIASSNKIDWRGRTFRLLQGGVLGET